MGAGGSGTGGGPASVYLPKNQGAAEDTWAQILGPLAGLSANAGAGTPGAWAYPQGQSLFPRGLNVAQEFLTGDVTGQQPTQWDQNVGRATAAANYAGDLYGGLVPGIYNQIQGLTSGAGTMAGYLPQLMANAFNPLYGQQVEAVQNNPFYAGAMSGAQRGAQLGGQGAENLYGMGQGVMMSGFDPQSALFNRGQQRTLDRANAVNAMSGVGTSPYGAGTTNTALTNYDLDWQDRQLGRQTQASQAAQPLFAAAPGLANASAALPGQAYLSQIDAVLKALGAQNQAGIAGVGAGNALNAGVGSALGQANTLGQSLAANTAQFGGLPYSTGQTIGANAQSSLANLLQQLTGTSTLGNQQFTLPLSVMGQLSDYLGLGQKASQLSGELGQRGFNQTAAGIGGLMSGGNMLFNPTSGMFPGTFGSLGLGATGAGAAGAGGLGSAAASALPLAASSDRRLKRDVSRIGTLENGLPVYFFRYRWSEDMHIGLMADEVEQVHPEAVIEGPFGYKLVNYAAAVR